MWFRKILRVLLPTLAEIPASSSKAYAAIVAKAFVRSYARGNVNLQRGRYVTSADIDARKQKLAQHSF